MKALTLWQPWASLIAIGAKTIETRSWPAPKSLIGQRIAVHAAKRQPLSLYKFDGTDDLIADHWSDGAWWLRQSSDGVSVPLPLGAVVCTARLAASVPMIRHIDTSNPDVPFPNIGVTLDGTVAFLNAARDRRSTRDLWDQLPYGDFTPGRWAWLLDDIESFDNPITASGRQRIWEWTR